jgi:hypothetical protein
MKNKMWKTMAALLTSAVLAGCATIMGQSAPEALNVRSAPDQATVVILDESGTKIFEGKTPTSLPLEKKRGYFSGKKYSVNIKKDGFDDQNIAVDTKVNGWYVAGNLLFGGVIGWLIVDPATGAMWKLDTNEINVTLKGPRQGRAVENTRIVLLEDVPPSLRSKMIRVTQ